MQASKIAYSAIFILGVVVGIIFGQFLTVQVAQAATTYEMPSNLSVGFYDNAAPSGGETTNRYVFRYRIPVGTTFDRLQMHVPDTQPNLSGGGWFLARMLDNNDPYESCTDYTCVQTDSQIVQLSELNHSKIGLNTLQVVYTASTTMSSNPSEFIILVFNPNAGGDSVLYYQTLDGAGYSENGSNNQRVHAAPTIKLCNGVCDNNDFIFAETYTPLAQNYTIQILEPDYGTTTATTTVNLKAFYFYDAETATNTKAQIQIFDYLSNTLEFEYTQIVPAGFTVNFTLDTNTELATGSKKMIARYVAAASEIDIMPPKESFFSVLENTYLLSTGLSTPQSTAQELTQIDCELFDVGCQFQKALTFLFIPPQTTLDKFSSLWRELATLKPFGYITQILEQLRNINSSATGAYTLPAIPFVDTIFAPFRAALAVMLWGVFAFVFYRRIKNIEI